MGLLDVFFSAPNKKDWDQIKQIIQNFRPMENKLKTFLPVSLFKNLDEFSSQRVNLAGQKDKHKLKGDNDYKANYTNMVELSKKLNKDLKTGINSLQKAISDRATELKEYEEARDELKELQIYVEHKYEKAFQQFLEESNKIMAENLKNGSLD